jgi:glycosyltransferase involved in cell wall biosynthesis
MSSDVPKVSVRLPCYNEEKNIAQAIESILVQRTDFEIEIVVGDDFSTDKTSQIISEYAHKHPQVIRVLKREKGDHYNQLRQKYGRSYNYVDILYNCRGSYVAQLDGDDYWTSPDKLQRQADFLDANPDCSVCFHDVECLYENGENPKYAIAVPKVRKERYTLEDLLRKNFMVHSSVMFRRGLFGEFPGIFLGIYPADWVLHILNAQYGDIGHISEVMGVYRVHSGGVWSHGRSLQWFRNEINMYKLLNVYFAGKYRKAIAAGILYTFVRLLATPFHRIETKIGLALRRSGFKVVADFYRRIFYPESFRK